MRYAKSRRTYLQNICRLSTFGLHFLFLLCGGNVQLFIMTLFSSRNRQYRTGSRQFVPKAICTTVDTACDRLERDGVTKSGRPSVHKPIASADALTQTVSGSPQEPTERTATIDLFRLHEICVKEQDLLIIIRVTRKQCYRIQNCLTFFPEARRGIVPSSG
jgi:hypothetical protein